MIMLDVKLTGCEYEYAEPLELLMGIHTGMAEVNINDK